MTQLARMPCWRPAPVPHRRPHRHPTLCSFAGCPFPPCGCRFRIEFETFRADLQHNDRAILDGETDGFVKLTCAKGSAQLLGATIVAAHAGDMVAELTLAIKEGVSVESLARVIHPYPTVGESVMGAALGYVRANWRTLAA